jgi:hypothetical protein
MLWRPQQRCAGGPVTKIWCSLTAIGVLMSMYKCTRTAVRMLFSTTLNSRPDMTGIRSR